MATIEAWTSPRPIPISGHRSLANAPRGRRLLGRVVRPVPPAWARARASGHARAGKLELVKVDVDANPGARPDLPGPGDPGRQGVSRRTGRGRVRGRPAPAAVDRFLDSLLPSEADGLVGQGDEASLRRALELEPTRADAAVALARMLLARDENDEARADPRSSARELRGGRARRQDRAPAGRDPRVAGPRARVRGARRRRPGARVGAADRRAPIRRRRPRGIRRVVVGILDELGVEHPLARESRRKLASALY